MRFCERLDNEKCYLKNNAMCFNFSDGTSGTTEGPTCNGKACELVSALVLLVSISLAILVCP